MIRRRASGWHNAARRARPLGETRRERANMNETEMMIESQVGIFLTPEGHAALQTELEHLTSVKRPEIAERIRESQQHGEFAEDNSELDEVKFEQAIVENRIADLKGIFGSATILEMDKIPTDHVGIGSLVSVTDGEESDAFDLRVVSGIEADPDRDMVSSDSPMGAALLGHVPGDNIYFDSPDGRKKFKLLAISR